MASYVDSSLMQGESVVHRGRLHWIVMARPIFLTFVGFVFMVVGILFPDALSGLPAFLPGAIAMLFGVCAMFISWINCISTELAVTDRRVIAKFGFIARRTYEISLRRVEGAHVEQSLTGRLLNFGTVVVKGTGGGASPIPRVREPMAFRLAVAEAIEAVDTRNAAVEFGGA